LIVDDEGCTIFVDDLENGWVAKVQIAVENGQVMIRIWDEDNLPVPEPNQTICLCYAPQDTGE
jgi:hypothetical protein